MTMEILSNAEISWNPFKWPPRPSATMPNVMPPLAEEMAQKVEGRRKKELIQIAARCRRVPAEPPQTFLEALQSIWMTQALLVLSYGEDSIICPGRVDQFLFPFYQKDLEAGLIT